MCISLLGCEKLLKICSKNYRDYYFVSGQIMSQEIRKQALEKACDKLTERYYNTLNVLEGMSNGKPFLHVSSKEFNQGLEFLPVFYVIVTCEESEAEGLDMFKFCLMTYHGKRLSDIKVAMDPDMLEDTKLSLLEDLASNDIFICQGVQEVKERRWRQFLLRAKMSLLEKVKTTFFIEPFEDDVLLRSRSCKFLVKHPVRNNDPLANDFVRCEKYFMMQGHVFYEALDH